MRLHNNLLRLHRDNSLSKEELVKEDVRLLRQYSVARPFIKFFRTHLKRMKMKVDVRTVAKEGGDAAQMLIWNDGYNTALDLILSMLDPQDSKEN